MSHSKRRRLAAVVLAAGMAALTLQAPYDGSSAAAQARAVVEPASLTGTFVLAEPRTAAQARMDAAIESTVSGMSFFVRGIARDRLRETNSVPGRVQLDLSGERVTIHYDEDRYEGVDGAWRDVVARGQPTRLLVQREGPRLYATFRTGEGEKLMVQTISADGRHLWLDVTVTSERLPTPLTYRLPYRLA